MTHRITFHRLLFFLFIGSVSFAQTIQSIEINGADNFSQNDYQNWIKISAGSKVFDGLIDSVKKNISYNLSLEGFYNFSFRRCSIEPGEDSLSKKLTIDIDEGTPTYIRNISFTSGKTDSVEIKNYLDDLNDKIFSQQNLDLAFNNILNSLENDGYPYASIKLNSVELSTDTSDNTHYADLDISIEKNQKAVIDKILITGNTKTKDYVITRALGIEPGDVYSQKKIEEIPARLNRLRFFERVEKPTFYFDSKNEGILSITVKEKQTNNFDGIVGYVPSNNANETGYFTGYVNIGLRNLFGTARSAAVLWQQENQTSQTLELHYLEPWLFGYPFNLQLGLYQRKQDSTYVQKSFDATLEFLATDEISASFLLSSQSTIPTAREIPTFTVFSSSSIVTGVNLKIDTRDDIYSPTKGLLFISNFKSSLKKIDGPQQYITPDTKTRVNFQRIELDFDIFHEIFKKHVVALGLHARELKGNDFEVSDLYLLGGANTLRGYKEKQFQGNRIFWSNLEYRYLIESRSFVFLFFDTGYYLRNEDVLRNILKTSGFKIGYGLGLNIETGLGVLSVSFALGKGDSFSEGKIHFGLLNEF